MRSNVLFSTMSRRRLLRLGLVTGSAALLAACGSPQPSAPAKTESKPAETKPAAPAATTAPAKPADAKPTAAPAAQTKPADKPAETKPATTTSGAPKVLTISQDIEPRSLDPHFDVATLTTNVHRHMFDTLVRRDDKLQLEGAVAESWRNVDPLTWEFKLRRGIKFHDGSELTAEDVKFSFDRMLDPQLNLQVRSFVASIAKTEIVDPTTIRLITGEPDVLLPTRITFGAFILPKKAFEAVGAEAFGLKPVGSGPFKFVEWVKDQRVVMEKNPDYWGGPPKLDRLQFKNIPEASTRMAALKTGEADIVNKVPVQDIDSVKADSKLRLAPVHSNRLAFFGFNTFEPPFDNQKLRLAINHAVDVEAIMQSVLGGYAVRILLAPEMYVGNDPTIKPYPYDVERAKQLLAEAGHPNGLEVTIESARAGSTPNDTLLTQAVAGQLNRIGIRTNIVQADFGAYVQKWLRKEVKGMYLFSFGGPILDMDALMGAHFDSKRRAPYYNRPDLDAMIAEAKGNFDPNSRKAQYSKIIQLIKDDAPWLFMFSADDVYAANARVKNWEPRADEAVWVYQADVEG